MKKLVIFDLDGTLLDTSEGIFNSVRYAESRMGLQPITNSELKKFVGPSPQEMYRKMYGLNNEESIRATGYHREYGRMKAVDEVKAYPEVETLLLSLRERGYILAVATLKQEEIAKNVLIKTNLYKYFDTVSGMNKKETLSKKDTIENVWKRVGKLPSILIGDTDYDYEGAKMVKCDFIGVTYGFGFIKGTAYPFKTVGSADELLKCFDCCEQGVLYVEDV